MSTALRNPDFFRENKYALQILLREQKSTLQYGDRILGNRNMLSNPDSFQEQNMLPKIRILLRESNLILSSGNRELITFIWILLREQRYPLHNSDSLDMYSIIQILHREQMSNPRNPNFSNTYCQEIPPVARCIEI